MTNAEVTAQEREKKIMDIINLIESFAELEEIDSSDIAVYQSDAKICIAKLKELLLANHKCQHSWNTLRNDVLVEQVKCGKCGEISFLS